MSGESLKGVDPSDNTSVELWPLFRACGKVSVCMHTVCTGPLEVRFSEKSWCAGNMEASGVSLVCWNSKFQVNPCGFIWVPSQISFREAN